MRALLTVVGLVLAILAGFVVGLKVGEHSWHKPQEAQADSLQTSFLAVDTLDTLAMASQDTAFVSEAPDSTSVEAVEETPERYQPTKKEIAAGVEYLATHNRWNRDEMEKFPALQGLWDAVNTYQLDEIKRYNDYLSSTPLITIVEGLERSPKHGFYASRSDHVITLSTYIKRLR